LSKKSRELVFFHTLFRDRPAMIYWRIWRWRISLNCSCIFASSEKDWIKIKFNRCLYSVYNKHQYDANTHCYLYTVFNFRENNSHLNICNIHVPYVHITKVTKSWIKGVHQVYIDFFKLVGLVFRKDICARTLLAYWLLILKGLLNGHLDSP
jgi:hypothetical protein